MRTRGIVLRLHRWAGLSAGAVICLVSLSGAMLVYGGEIDRALDRDLWYPGGAGAPAGATAPAAPSALLSAAREHRGGQRIISLLLKRDPDLSVAVALTGGEQLLLHPADASLVARRRPDETLMGRVLTFHRNLFAGAPGKILVSASSVVLILLALLGLWLWWPAGRRKTGSAFRPALGRGWRRANYDLHSILGFYSFLYLLLLAATGIFFAYPSLQTALGRLVGARPTPPPALSETSPAAGRQGIAGSGGIADSVYDRALRRADQEFPTSVWRRIHPPPPRGGPLRITIAPPDAPHPGANHVLHFDPRAAVLLRIDRYENRSPVAKAYGWLGPIHTGSFLGHLSKSLAIAVCLVGATLPLSGALIWFPRWRRRRHRRAVARRSPSIQL